MKQDNLFIASTKHFKKTRDIAMIAMLIALYIVIDSFAIQFTPELRLTFSFIANALAGLLFGPVISMFSGAATDIICAILLPRGPYFPGYTLTAIISGLFYGLILYRKPITYLRMLVAKGIVNLFANTFLNTLWLSITGGKALLLLLPGRVGKNLLLLPIEALILFLIANTLKKFAPQLFVDRYPAPNSISSSDG